MYYLNFALLYFVAHLITHTHVKLGVLIFFSRCLELVTPVKPEEVIFDGLGLIFGEWCGGVSRCRFGDFQWFFSASNETLR
jgi:hypothetical protein